MLESLPYPKCRYLLLPLPYSSKGYAFGQLKHASCSSPQSLLPRSLIKLQVNPPGTGRLPDFQLFVADRNLLPSIFPKEPLKSWSLEVHFGACHLCALQIPVISSVSASSSLLAFGSVFCFSVTTDLEYRAWMPCFAEEELRLRPSAKQHFKSRLVVGSVARRRCKHSRLKRAETKVRLKEEP